MAEVKAFKGLRYSEKAGDIKELCCPPYDIINGEGRSKFLERNPNNIIRLELPVLPGSVADPGAYAAAGEILKAWMSTGILKNDDSDSLYIYEMEFKNPMEPAEINKTYKVKGYVGMVKLEEFSKGIVLPHEETLSKAKNDRFNLMTATQCNFSQIYSLYIDGDGSVYDSVEEASLRLPDTEFVDGDNVIHRIWRVTEPDTVKKIASLMSNKKIYIADGHHRYETALNYRNYLIDRGMDLGTAEYVPMMLVNMENDGLLVFPTHRIVKGLENYDYNSVIEKCGEYFEVIKKLTREKGAQTLEEAYRTEKKAFLLYSEKYDYTLLRLRDSSIMNSFMPNSSPTLKALDVSVLHTLILERIFGIDKESMTNQKNLIYTRIADEAINEVKKGAANCAFLLNPTRVNEIRDIAASGEKMPQKSTYFYPKLTTGLVMNKIIK